ncbi:MAG TPA: hypothetical protein VFK82_08915 [Burkholderiaceae bacterium]|nr:hypothetical protein [Burkholderiaceae bacterium]
MSQATVIATQATVITEVQKQNQPMQPAPLSDAQLMLIGGGVGVPLIG